MPDINPYLERERDRLLEREERRQQHQQRRDYGAVAGVLAGAGVAAAGIHYGAGGGLLGFAAEASRYITAGVQTAKQQGLAGFLGNVKANVAAAKTGTRDYQIKHTMRRMQEQAGAVEHMVRERDLYGRITSELDRAAQTDERVAAQATEIKRKLGHRLTTMARMSKPEFTYEMQRQGFDPELGESFYGLVGEAKAGAGVKDEAVRKTKARFLERARAQVAERHGRPEGLLQRMLGYRKATAQDLLNLQEKQQEFMFEEDTLRFIKKMQQEHGIDPSQIYPDDDLLIKGDRLLDVKPFTDLKRSIADTYAGGILGRLTYKKDRLTYLDHQEQIAHIMRPGHHQPGLADTPVVGEDQILQEPLVGIGDKVYTLDDMQTPLKEGMYFTSGRYGAIRRIMAQASGIDTDAVEPSIYQKMASGLGKYGDPEWERNKLLSAMYGGPDLDWKNVYDVERYLQTYTRGMSDDVLGVLRPHMKTEGVSFATTDDLLHSFKKMHATAGPDAKLHAQRSSSYVRQLYSMLDSAQVARYPGLFQQNKLFTGEDLLRREASKLAVGEVGEEKARRVIEDAAAKGEITARELADAKTAIASHMFDRVKPAGLEGYKGFFGGMTEQSHFFRGTVMDMAAETHPHLAHGPLEYKTHFTADTLAVEKPQYLGLRGAYDTMHEMVAGRKPPGTAPVTDLIPNMPYVMSSRINELLRQFGPVNLGLRDTDLGSTAEIWKNLMLKRVTPALAGMEALRYADAYFPGEYSLRQRHERALAGTRLGVARARDAVGLTGGLQWLDELTPGSHFLEEGLASVPFVGWAGRGIGLFSARTYEEEVEHYMHGMEPVRQGRWWPLSSTPWAGEGISHFEPPAYRQAMAQWQYTDTVYGDREQYFAHSWLPTPHYPLAPVRRFLTDPYWFEEHHRERRPYPLSGQLFDPNTPWGQLLNPTVGEVLKPVREYGAGAYDPWHERMLEAAFPEEEPDPTYMARYTGGQLDIGVYQPYTAEEELAMYGTEATGLLPGGPGHEASMAELEAKNAEIMSRAETPVEQGILESAMPLIRGRALSEFELEEQNELIKYIAAQQDLEREGYDYDTPSARQLSQRDLEELNISIKELAAERLRREELSGVLREFRGEDVPLELAAPGIEESARMVSQRQLEAINKAIKEGARVQEEFLEHTGVLTDYREPFTSPLPDTEIQDPRDPGYRAFEAAYSARYLAGIRGYLLAGMFDMGHGEGEAVLGTADLAYATSDRFWDLNLGGRGMALSEVARRFWRHRPRQREVVNELPNLMPDWMPGEDHYIDFQTGDPYGQIDRGEIRLPGEAYEAMNVLHPDEFGLYGAVDRAIILADTAPYSEEFYKWVQIARSQDLSEEAEQRLRDALDRRSKAQGRYEFTPYEYLGQDMERETVRVRKFIDHNRFLVHGDDTIYRMAGLHTSFDPETPEGEATLGMLREHMMPGMEIDLVTPAHGEGTMPAVVHAGGTNINRMLLQQGVPEREESAPIHGYVHHTAGGRAVGRLWELISHAQIPLLHNKFLAARSPIEHYERQNLYGREWQQWNRPIRDFVVPHFQQAASQHPLGAAVGGASFGVLAGMVLGGKPVIKAAAGLGAATAAGLSGLRMAYEAATGETWIPQRRRDEWELDKYFDVLEYIKNRRLYGKYREQALQEEGIDVEALVQEFEELEDERRARERAFEAEADRVRQEGLPRDEYVQQVINAEGRLEYQVITHEDYIDQMRDELRDDLEEITADQAVADIGPYTKRAIKYRNEYLSTLYGLEEGASFMQKYIAMPSRYREYFREFAQEEDPDKRERILEIVPPNQRRVYQRLWDMDVDERPDLREYFQHYHLPEPEWEGWREGVDLEASKMKLIEDEGFEVEEFNIWPEHTEEEELTPAPVPPGEDFRESIPTNKLRTRLRTILEDHDLDDIDIDIEPRDDGVINIALDVVSDVRSEIGSRIRATLGG